jgi:hypothetical protein
MWWLRKFLSHSIVRGAIITSGTSKLLLSLATKEIVPLLSLESDLDHHKSLIYRRAFLNHIYFFIPRLSGWIKFIHPSCSSFFDRLQTSSIFCKVIHAPLTFRDLQ